jgi:hypothetical protein
MTTETKLDVYHRRTGGEAPATGDEQILLRLGGNVRKLRELHAWTQAELGARVGEGRSQVWVSKLERGTRDVGLTPLPALAKALRTSVAGLLG